MLYTASSFISFYSRLEDQARNFYENLLDDERSAKARNTLTTFVKENKRHKERIQRSYQEVITDALEAAFPKKNLDEEDYEIDTNLTDELAFNEIIRKAINVEEKCYNFCRDAGDSLSGLLADVPETFMWVAKRKKRRKEKLESL
jgi:rubrerythrin